MKRANSPFCSRLLFYLGILALPACSGVAAVASDAPTTAARVVGAKSLRLIGVIRGEPCSEIRLQPLQLSSRPMQQDQRQGGDNEVRITDGNGAVTSLPFTVMIAQARSFASKHIHLNAPYPPAGVAAIEILHNGQPCPLRLPSAATSSLKITAPSPPPTLATASLQLEESSDQLHLRWNSHDLPWLDAIHVAPGDKRFVLSLDARGGELLAPIPDQFPAGGLWEMSLSNGVNALLLQIPRRKELMEAPPSTEAQQPNRRN